MVISIEVEEGKHLAEGIVKMLTGGDTVTARFLHKEAFEFHPNFKMWLAANHAPTISDGDAIWRRILLIPLDKIVPKEKRNPELKALLKGSPEGRAAILAWAVQGCLTWKKDGLGVPRAVKSATDEYRDEMDVVQQFILNRCLVSEGAYVGTTDLHKAFQTWQSESGDSSCMSKYQFADRLQHKGFERGRAGKKGDREWRGIALADAQKVNL